MEEKYEMSEAELSQVAGGNALSFLGKSLFELGLSKAADTKLSESVVRLAFRCGVEITVSDSGKVQYSANGRELTSGEVLSRLKERMESERNS